MRGKSAFETQVLGEWVELSEAEVDARRRWLTYYVETDRFDVAICGNPEGRPFTPEQRRGIAENARKVYNEQRLDALAPRVSRRAKRWAEDLSLERQVLELERLGRAGKGKR